ncbi:MAG TPA: hypothetical protein V6D03_13470, partial [Candidatus Caenarcaniphilales bacterium]
MSSKTTAPAPSPQIAPPAPEELQPPSATAMLTDGRLTIKLVNRTNAVMNYQAIGDTKERSLPGQTNITLQTLKVPTTLTFYRQDRGLLRVR